jgi:hypothetical protein
VRSRQTRIALVSFLLLLGAVVPNASRAVGPDGAPADATPDLPAVVAAYLRDYPGITEKAALKAATGQAARGPLLEELGPSPGFGGAWYDPVTDVLHIYSVTSDFEEGVLNSLYGRQLNVSFERTENGYADLQKLADEINSQRSDQTVAKDAVNAVVDGRWNKVAVIVSDPASLSAALDKYGNDPRVMVKDYSKFHPEPAACSTRSACGTPARSGIRIGFDNDGAGPGSATNQCSLGFTAAATDGSKWIVTAGHCSSGIAMSCPGASGTCWGHGQQYFGPMRSAIDSGPVDVGRIRLDNAYWGTGGWIYNPYAPNSPYKVNYSIIIRSTIEVGDAVCQAVQLAITGSECGTVVDVASFNGLVEASIGSCSTDSGGAWYYLSGSSRWAYGIESRSDDVNFPTCHNAGVHSYFSAIPDINAYWDSTSSATVRVQYQP